MASPICSSARMFGVSKWHSRNVSSDNASNIRAWCFELHAVSENSNERPSAAAQDNNHAHRPRAIYIQNHCDYEPSHNARIDEYRLQRHPTLDLIWIEEA